LDFGLARAIDVVSENSATQTTVGPPEVEGTLRYMAPEQLRGETIDARTDIYAAGSVLYEMSTGQVPFDHKLTTAVVDAILHESPKSPRAINSAISPRLEDIIVKCLEKNPGDRYQSAKELAVDLRRASPSTGAIAIAPASRRSYWPPALFGAIGLAIVIAAAVTNPRDWRARFFGRA